MQNKYAQNAQQPENDPRQEQVRLLSEQITQNQTNPISITNQIISTIELLINDADYGASNQAILSTLKNKYKELLSSLEGGINKSASIKYAQQVQMPATPSPDYENATSLFNRLETLQQTLKGLLSRQSRYMEQGSNLVDQASNANQDWALQYSPQSENWKNTQIKGWELGLLNKRASTLNRISSKVFSQWKKEWIGGASAPNVFRKVRKLAADEGLELNELTQAMQKVLTAFAQLERAYGVGVTDTARYREHYETIDKYRSDVEIELQDLFALYDDVYKQIVPTIEKYQVFLDQKSLDELYNMHGSGTLGQPIRERGIIEQLVKKQIEDGIKNTNDKADIAMILSGPHREFVEIAEQRHKQLSDRQGSLRRAYPIMHTNPTKKAPDVDKWKKVAIKMDAFSRVYGKVYTKPQILYHFTSDWDMFERYSFKKWYNWNKKASNNKMKKSADSITSDRLQQFTAKRKKLMSRINLVRKALYELINNGLVEDGPADRMSKTLYMLEHDAMKLKAPKLAAARVRRAAKHLNKFGFTEGGKVLKQAAEELLNPTSMIKTAQPNSKEAVSLLRKIKSEMDSLNYSKHLDSLFHIKKELEAMGRAGDVEAVEKIIRDDLSALEKLNKKLTEVYTNLSKVPLELSESDDQYSGQQEEQVVEAPIEVVEEKPQPRQPAKRVPERRPARPAGPVVRERIPNV